MASVRRRLVGKQPCPAALQDDAAIEAAADGAPRRPDSGVKRKTGGQTSAARQLPLPSGGKTPSTQRRHAEFMKAQRVTLKKAQAAAKLPKVRKPFAVFCESWLFGRSLPQKERFKEAAKAWRDVSPAEREEWKQKASAEALEWKIQTTAWASQILQTAAMQQGLYKSYNSSAMQQSPEICIGDEKTPRTPTGPWAAGPPDTDVSMVCGPYTWRLADKYLLGRGSYGAVYLGCHCPTLEPVAVKVYVDAKSVEKEAEFLKEAGKKVGPHSPFPKVFAVLDTAPMQAIVMEAFVQDLRCWLHGNVPGAHLQQSVVCQIGGALAHLHNVVKIVHLDVKAANILLNIAHNRIVLCDFSCAEKIRTKEPSCPMYVTLHYRPLEFFVHSRVPSCLLQPAADLWGFGCVVWELGARGHVQKPFRHFFQSDSTSGVQGQCQNYVNVVHGARNIGSLAHTAWLIGNNGLLATTAYWLNRLAEAGSHRHTVKCLCHPQPHCRQLPNMVGEPQNMTASMFRG